MEEVLMSKAELVEEFGSEECKRHFAKYGKFKNKNIETALIRNVECYFEEVKTVKEGKVTSYELINRKTEVSDKVDNRISNGSYTSYTKKLDIIVVSALEQGDISDNAQTLNKWCLDFGVIEPELHELVTSKYKENLKEQHIKELQKVNILQSGQERIVSDFIRYTQYLQSQLAGTLKRMEKSGIIEYYLVPMGYIEKEAKTVKLHEGTLKKIHNLKRKLMEKHDVSEWYLNTYANAKKTREYKVEWKEEISRITDENEQIIGLSYWYKTYAIMLKARENRIITYLEKYNKDVIQLYKDNEGAFMNANLKAFVEERGKYVELEAKKNESWFLQPRTKNTTLEDLGGKDLKRRPKIDDYPYDEAYYALYFNEIYASKIKELQDYYGHKFK